MFSVTGKVKEDPTGRTRTITWDNGSFSGDQKLVARVVSGLKILEGEPLGPIGGPETITNHTKSALTTLSYIESLMQGVPTFKGDIPARPQLPTDAKG